MEAHCITKIAIVEEQHILQSACSFPRSQIVLLATKKVPLLGEERRLRMESHHDGDETKGSVHSFVQDYIEARKASRMPACVDLLKFLESTLYGFGFPES